MKIHRLTVAGAFASMKSGLTGLSDAEARRRLVEFGANEVEEVAREALLLTLAKEFAHFFAIILWIAAALAFFAEWREPGQGMATLGFAIVGVILINGVFSFWQAYRAGQALAALKKLLPNATKVMRSGAVRELPASDLVPGDLILLEAGDILPADCRLVEAFGVRVNNATVTGESLPASRDAEPCNEPEPMHSHNTLLAGTSPAPRSSPAKRRPSSSRLALIPRLAKSLNSRKLLRTPYRRSRSRSHASAVSWAGSRYRSARSSSLLVARSVCHLGRISFLPSALSWRTCRRACSRPSHLRSRWVRNAWRNAMR